jgi:predicted KAP-like P-loop ATPase
VAVREAGAVGTALAPEELELLLEELDEDELDELEEELEEEDEPVPLEVPPPDELEDEELEDEELDVLLFGVAEASFDSTLVPVLFTAATLK